MNVENTQLQAVLQHQEDVKTALTTISTLENTIMAQRQMIHDANNFATNVPELLTQRENLLAEIATGNKNRSELDDLNAEIDAAQKELNKNTANAATVVSEATATISGLERQLEKARTELNRLNGIKNSVINSFLQKEAALIGREYINKAFALVEKYNQLIAIDNLIRRNGSSQNTIFRLWTDKGLQIPLFKVSACAGLDYSPQLRHNQNFEKYSTLETDILYESIAITKFDEVRATVENTEKRRIAALGIDL